MRPRTTTAVIAAVTAVLVCGGYTAYWFVAAAWVRDGVAAWAEARRAKGLTAAYDGLEVSGFPARLVAEVTAPRLGRPGAWRWSGERLVAEMRPWNVERARFRVPAGHRLIYTPAPDRSALSVSGGDASGALETADGKLSRVVVDVADVVIATPNGSVDIARVRAGSARDSEATLDLRLAIDGITLPRRLDGPLGREVRRLTAEATVTGTLPPRPLAAALESWRSDGGAVEVHALGLEWGPLSMRTGGRLALDKALRPAGELDVAIEGYGAVIDALVRAGVTKPESAATVTAFLDLLAARREGERRVLEVPVSAEAGVLYVGPVPVAKLKPMLPPPD